MLSTWPSLVLIVLTLSDIFGACYAKSKEDREKLNRKKNDQQYKINKKVFFMNSIQVYNVVECPLLNIHIDQAIGIPFGRFYLPLRDEGGDVLIDTYTIERVENTYELLGLFSKRLNLATEIISLSEELDNGVDAKLRLSAYDDDDDDQVDEDDDGTYKALDDYHHHTSKQFMAHLRNFLRKSSKHGISFNDTADLLSHIFASPWSVDDHGMPLCLSDCIVRAKHQQTSPSPPYTTVHPIVQMIGHPPREDHHNHPDHTDYQQVEIFFYCSNACKNALLGRGMELLGK